MRLTPARIVAAYVAFAATWILLSDTVVAVLPLSTDAATVVGVAKGWLFVAVTGALLLLLVRRFAAEVAAQHEAASRAETRLAGLHATLAAVSAAQDAATRATAESEVLSTVCHALTADGRVRCAWIGLGLPGGDVEMVARSGDDRGYFDGLSVRWDEGPLGVGPSGRALREGRTVTVADPETDDRMGPWRERLASVGLRSSAAVPIAADGTVDGVISIYAANVGAIDRDLVAEVERVAAETALAIRAIRVRTERDTAVAAEAEASRRLAVASERYARLVLESPLSIVVTDLDGTVVEWNPAAEKLWRLSASDAIGAFAPWVIPGDEAAFLALIGRVAAGERPAGSIRVRRRGDGSTATVRVANAAFVDPDGAVRILGISEDVTDQVEAERALQRSLTRLDTLHDLDRAILAAHSVEEVCGVAALRLRRLVRVERIAISLIDRPAGLLRLVAVEDASGEGPGVGAVAPLDRGLPTAVVEALEPIVYRDVRAAFGDTLVAASLSARGIANVAYAPIVADGAPVGWIAAMATATQAIPDDVVDVLGEAAHQLALALRQAAYRDELAAREARLRAILDASPDAILTAGADMRVRYANPAAIRGLAGGEDLAGRPISDLVVAEAYDALARLVARAIAEPEAAPVMRLPDVDGRRTDGTVFPAAVQVAPIPGRVDAEVEVEVTIHDLSERVALEMRLAQAQRVETLGRFAGILAHDVRTYFTAIDWSAGSLAADLPADDPRQADVRLIAGAVAEARELIGSVLEFARPGGPAGSTDLASHVRRLGGILARMLGPEIEISVDVPADLPPVALGPASVTQILVNLATNARDAIRDGGGFTITARPLEVDGGGTAAPSPRGPGAPDLDASTGRAAAAGGGPLPPGRYVRLEVADTGVGMDSEAARAAFDAFYTTKGEGLTDVGTGLGLASIHLVVVRAGGEISISSEPGQGTRFTIDLPVAD